MASLQRIVFMATLLTGLGVATLPSLGWADQPCPAPATLSASAPEALPDLIEENVLEPMTEHLEAGVEVLKRVEDHAEKWRELKDDIAERIDRIVPLEGRESGGVRQLHPLRGTFLIRKDYAQQTLEEDWFLKPSLGTAALHLDVPYDAEVYVKLSSPDQTPDWKGVPVRSTGRYRDLVLTNIPVGRRQPVYVTAERWTTDPKCSAKTTHMCKQVGLQAGDRRYLQFTEEDFEKVALASFAQATDAAAILAPVVTTAPQATSLPDQVFKFQRPKRKLFALVGYYDDPTKGGRAQSFTFEKAADTTPGELVLVHGIKHPDLKLKPDVELAVTLILTWKRAHVQEDKEPDMVYEATPTKVKLTFDYDDKTRQGTTTIDFAENRGFRKLIEGDQGQPNGVKEKLSLIDSPQTMTMSGRIELPGGQKFDIGGPLEISLR